MTAITCVDDLRRLAARRVPRMFFDYVDGGSWTEQTLRENRQDFGLLHLRQRVAIDVSHRTTVSTMLGQPVAMPVAIAPTGLTGMVHADGEILAARAAQKFGVPYTLSTVAICGLEDLADNVEQPFWFQLYVMRDRQFVNDLLDRAAAVECSALVLTLDLPLSGHRHKDARNGLTSPPRPTVRNLAGMLTKPRWCAQMLLTRRRRFGTLVGHVDGLDDLDGLARWTDSQFDPSMDWSGVRFIRERWKGKLIVKGILDNADAERAVECGADAIVVSNHGGRQLDGAISSISALPEVVAAVGDRVEVQFDGGIQSGQDVFKAIALGAKGTYVGRSMLYGLGALGERGVARVLEIIGNDLDKTMGLCGVNSVDAIGPDSLIFGNPLSRMRPKPTASPVVTK
ncbi:MAG: alpha-hydroxy acid oxidase [Rhodobacteraceae bacterium]|nr:alpha-hydroxy acid oxidase [Paracoccaceae bacterium]MCY4141898.1 alpha-hydroxy acid oxidase [Paracoccaceae bacterium]